jgi:hypothetical protein
MMLQDCIGVFFYLLSAWGANLLFLRFCVSVFVLTVAVTYGWIYCCGCSEWEILAGISYDKSSSTSVTEYAHVLIFYFFENASY